MKRKMNTPKIAKNHVFFNFFLKKVKKCDFHFLIKKVPKKCQKTWFFSGRFAHKEIANYFWPFWVARFSRFWPLFGTFWHFLTSHFFWFFCSFFSYITTRWLKQGCKKWRKNDQKVVKNRVFDHFLNTFWPILISVLYQFGKHVIC